MLTRIFCFISCFMLVTGTADVSAMSSVRGSSVVIHPIITEKNGNVLIKGSKLGIWEPVVKDTLVLSSDLVSTSSNSWARLEFRGGSIEMYGSSLLYVPSIKGDDGELDILDVSLLKGVAKFDIKQRNSEHFFGFKTENTVGIVKGTLFVVSTDEEGTNIAVFKGEVSLKDPDRKNPGELFLSRGHVARILTDGTIAELDVFNAYKALLMLEEGVAPDISDEGLRMVENDRDADNSERDEADRDKDRDDGDKDKDKDKDDGDKDKDDGDKDDGRDAGDRRTRGNNGRFTR